MAAAYLLAQNACSSLLFFFFILTLVVSKLIKSRLSSSKTNMSKLPTPPKLPIIGHLNQLGSYPHRTLLSMAKRYGPLMLINLGTAPAVVISSRKVVQEMVKNYDPVFSNRKESHIYRRLMYDCNDLLLAPYGDYWRQMRAVIFSQLLSPKIVQSLQYLREQETTLMMGKIRGFDSSPFDLTHMFDYLTKDILYIATLGKRFSTGKEDEDKLTRLFIEFNALLGVFNIGDYISWLSWINYFNGLYDRIEKNHKEIDELLEEVIDDQIARRKDPNHEEQGQKYLLDALLDAQNGTTVTRASAKAVILDMFAGGIDTVSIVLEWAMTELLRHPDVLKRTQKEVMEVVGDTKKITKNELGKMNYLKAVLKESMRIHPPFPLIPRVSNQEVELQGYTIPAKTRVLINIWAVGRDPVSWEEPEKFKPERFMKNDSAVEYQSPDFSWMIFGFGRRGCPGNGFGMALVEYVIASLLLNFDWSLPEGQADIDMDEYAALALHKLKPLVVVATPRTVA